MNFNKYIILYIFSLCLFGACENKQATNQIALETRDFVGLNTDSNIIKLNKLIIQNPKDASLFHERSKLFMKQGKVNEALADIKSTLLLDTTKAAYFVTLSDIYWEIKELIPSEDALNKALKIDPQFPLTYFRKGKLAFYAQKPDKALTLLNQGLKLDVNNAEGYFWKGMTYIDLKNIQDARSNLTTAIERDPTYYDAYFQLGVLLVENEDEIGLKYLNNAINLDSTRTDALYARGYYYQMAGQIELAKADYEQILRHHQSADASYNLGFMLLKNDDFLKAIPFFEQATQYETQYANAWYNLGLCYEGLNKRDEAKKHFEKAISLDPKHEKAKNGLYRLR